MILLGLTIFVVVLGIIIILYCKIKRVSSWSSDLPFIGSVIIILGGAFLFLELLILIIKPINYIDFKSKYDTINNIELRADDLRDATITKEIIEINKEININKKMKDNIWIGIFYNEEISNLDLLNKEVQ